MAGSPPLGPNKNLSKSFDFVRREDMANFLDFLPEINNNIVACGP